MTLFKDNMPYFDSINLYIFMVEIWVYSGPPLKFGHPKISQLPILGTQFLNPG